MNVLNPDFGSGLPFIDADDANIFASDGHTDAGADDSDEDDDDGSDLEWTNGDSYSWRLIRLVLLQLAGEQVKSLVRLLNLDSDCQSFVVDI